MKMSHKIRILLVFPWIFIFNCMKYLSLTYDSAIDFKILFVRSCPLYLTIE